MGDRTTVFLSFPKAYEDAVNNISDGHSDRFTEEPDLVCLRFDDVDSGTLDFESDLIAMGIPYDKAWDAGANYTSGKEYFRFEEDGTAVSLVVYDEDKDVPLLRLMNVINNHEELKEIILDHHKKVTPLPWENQIEYSKRYRLKKLITAAEANPS